MIGRLAQLGRLWRTVRWLKAEQVLGRLRFRLQRPRPRLAPAPPLRDPTGPWVQPAMRNASLLSPTRLRLLAEEHDLDESGWDATDVALLWRYNLHYFDDLNADGAADRRPWQRALVQRWCEQNPPGRGTGWAPYPASQRIVNWIKWFRAGVAPEPAWLHSLAVQARWLTQRLEWHLLGNHLFLNAKALVHAGLFFGGAEAEAWLACGLRILERELPEQILPDGGHFERSPMYHALALEDLLDLLNIVTAQADAGSPARRLLPDLRSRAALMLAWLRCLRHADGTLVRFNDCAEGVAPPMAELERFAAALGVTADAPAGGVQLLQASGYVRLAQGPAVAWLDVAPVGPDYLPGHAHADTLSFEFALAGRAVVVNRGTSVYGTGPRRLWERGTAAHSTVQLAGHDSSEVWSGFRVGRRARPGPLQVQGLRIGCSHGGYTHLAGAPRHHRSWQLEEHGLLVEDRLEPPAREGAVSRFHLAPGLRPERADGAAWRIIDETGREIARADVIAGRAEAVTTRHATQFGQLVDAATLEIHLDGARAALRFAW